MTGLAFHPPVHLVIHPDEPIRTVDDAVKVIERHARDPHGPEAEAVMLRLTRAANSAELEAAANVFRDWAKAEGLLLLPPEDI
jgi:hypothetical protein